MTRHIKPRSRRPLSPEKLQRREAIFAFYSDMGPGRTRERLIEVIRPDYGPLGKRTLVNWSRDHNWRARLAEHDRRLTAAQPSSPVELGPNFDMVDALKRIAQLALQRALQMPDGKPRELKTLVETAEKAMMLVEKLREIGVGQRSPEEANEAQQEMRSLMAFIKKRVREKHEAEGHPVRDHVTADETVDEAPGMAGDAATPDTPSPDATVH
jgi:hypothetical protein